MTDKNKDTNWDEFEWEEDSNKNSFADFYFLIKKLLPFIILFAILGAGLSWLYYKTLEPQFLVKAKILIKDEQGQGSLKNADIFQSLGVLTGSSSVDNELEIITTYSIMDKVVRDLNLNVETKKDQFFNTRDRNTYEVPWEAKVLTYNKNVFKNVSTHAYEIITEKDHQYIITENGKQNFKWSAPVNLPVGTVIFTKKPHAPMLDGKWNLAINKPSKTVESYIQNIIPAVPNKNTSIITLEMKTPNPEKDKLVLNKLIDTYVAEGVKDNNSINDSTLVFINERLAEVSGELQDVEKAIQSFKQKNQLTDINEQTKVLLDATKENSQKLIDAEIQLNVVSSLENYLQNSSNAHIVPASLLTQDAALSSLINQYNNLIVQKDRLGKTATPENPMMKNLNTQVGSVRSELLSSIRSTRNSYAMVAGQLRGEAGRNIGMIRKIPQQEREFLDISRQQAIKQELFLFLLKKREETAIGKSSTLSNTRVIDYARVIDKPVSPKRNMFILAGLLIGTLLPLIYYFIRKKTNIKLENKNDIKKRTQMPLLGEISHQNNPQLFEVFHNPRSPLAEQFRILRTNLHFYQKQDEATTVMLTSSMPGEGKTFISLNLAATLAANKEVKVLLMGMDLRKPQLARELQLKDQKGFSDYAIQNASLEETIYPVAGFKNLFVLPSGTIPPNPSELLMSKEAKVLFSEIKKQYDFIVIDCPPTVVTDYQLVSKFADITLFVSRIGYTEKRQLEIADELFRSGKLPKMNLVVNDFDPEKYDGYNSNYYYQYGYYDTDVKRKSFLSKIFTKK